MADFDNGLFIISYTCCRSSLAYNRNLASESSGNVELSSVSSSASTSQTHSHNSTSDITSEKQYLRTTWYRPDGTIRKIQEEGRKAERTCVAVHDTGSSAVHVSENKTDSTAATRAQTKEVVHEDTSSDSRPVQGSEWGWIAGVFALVVVVFGYMKYKKSR